MYSPITEAEADKWHYVLNRHLPDWEQSGRIALNSRDGEITVDNPEDVGLICTLLRVIAHSRLYPVAHDRAEWIASEFRLRCRNGRAPRPTMPRLPAVFKEFVKSFLRFGFIPQAEYTEAEQYRIAEYWLLVQPQIRDQFSGAEYNEAARQALYPKAEQILAERQAA